MIVAGVLLRAWAMVAEYPASWNNWDTTAYLYAARNGLFDNAFRPAGYPLFLRVLHDVWPSVGVTVAVQHLLGVAAGALAYFTARRVGLSRPLSVAPAAILLLNVDQVSLEHAMLSESIFTPLLVATLYALVRALDSERPHAWLVAAGALTAAMVSVRVAALPLVGGLALAAGVMPPRSGRLVLSRAAAAGGTAVLLVVAYAALAHSFTGHFAITRSGGWAIYARAAPFADCGQFMPPGGTRRLCEQSSREARPGPGFYMWIDGSPAWRAFGGPPNGSEKVGAFGRAAILNQPLTYAGYVLSDAWRYVDSASGHRGAGFGNGPETLFIDRRAEGVERYTADQVASWYGPEPLRVRSGLSTLADVQELLRFHGSLVLAAVLLTALAAALGRGRARWAALVCGGAALTVMLVPPVTHVYHARYGVPVVGMLALGAALGVSVGWPRAASIVRAAARRRPFARAQGL